MKFKGLPVKLVSLWIMLKSPERKKTCRLNLVGTGELTMGLGPVAGAGCRLRERWVEGEEKMGRLGSVPQAGLGRRRLQLGLGGAAKEAKQGCGSPRGKAMRQQRGRALCSTKQNRQQLGTRFREAAATADTSGAGGLR